jgi:hypothetical protein
MDITASIPLTMPPRSQLARLARSSVRAARTNGRCEKEKQKAARGYREGLPTNRAKKINKPGPVVEPSLPWQRFLLFGTVNSRGFHCSTAFKSFLRYRQTKSTPLGMP